MLAKASSAVTRIGAVSPAVTDAGALLTARCVAAAGETVKEPVLMVVRAPSARWSVLAPALSIRRLLKLAIPLTAATVVVPARVPLPVLSVAVTLELSPVTVLP